MRNAVGLDISAKTFDVVTIINGETDYRKFSNDEQGCKNLKEWISAKREKDIYVCMEATGNYYEQAADCLAEEYHVSVINPLKIKAYAQKRFSRVK
ncbi:TPA: transposase, partial [Neisseria meningitidis]